LAIPTTTASYQINYVVATAFVAFPDIDVAPPSFDLGFDISPAPAPEATPDPKSFLKVTFTPSNKFEATPQPGGEPSSGLVELPLTIASKHLAQCLVLDIVMSQKQEVILLARYFTDN